MIRKILACLPGTDCGQCGMSCQEFARFLGSGELTANDCPLLAQPDYAQRLPELLGLLQVVARRAKSGHIIDADRCIGCGICVTICEYNLANCTACRYGKGPEPGARVALRVVNGCVVLADENLCTRLQAAADKCSKCQDQCPTQAIVLL